MPAQDAISSSPSIKAIKAKNFASLVANLYGTAASDNERTEHFVNDFYLGAYGRNATPTELQQQRDALNAAAAQGLSQVQAQAQTFGRSLFAAQVNDGSISNTQYVTNLYEAFLQRGPDTVGLGYWSGQASVGSGRQNVLNAFATCPAFRELSGTLYREANWLVSDHLGTPRMIANKSGALSSVRRHDYLPFGEEIGGPQVALIGGRTTTQGYGGDIVRQKFTLYERDNETGLDYAKARSYAYTRGRFTTPDPLPASGEAAIPQSWNRYSYVLNNPLKFIDPSGMMWVYHYLDKNHTRIGIGWIDGNKISKELQAHGYQALNFGGEDSIDVTASNGSVVRLNANSSRPELLRGPQTSGGNRAYVNTGLINEVGRQTAPVPAATGLFALTAAAGAAGAGASVINAVAYGLVAASQMGQTGSSEQSPGEVVAGTRAVEYNAGQISETGFLDAAQKYLGPGSKELSPGRWASADGMRQVRFGAHETRGPGLHAHFEAYDMAGGRVVENSVVRITPR